MADVFVSYKRDDGAKVRKLVSALRGQGLDVWWDEEIAPSAPWEATIEEALAKAKAVIVCWSPKAVRSENVRSEARVAREDGRLIQASIAPCTPPLFFGERQAVDLSTWRGRFDDPKIARIAETARAIAAGKVLDFPRETKRRDWIKRRVQLAGAMISLLLASIGGWLLLKPAHTSGLKTVAVLPFRALNPADANLVDAIWDDTRGALSKNPNLRVLGREAVTVLAKQGLEPAGYRRKVGADFLLDGSVEHIGNRVRMKLSLTRTNDAAEVWSDEVGGKLDDVFAFQQRVAREVEGRIRGRLAPGGGVKPQNIATTGDVYALYAEARAKMRQRNGAGWHAGAKLLRQALATDPNYAPAWAELAVATRAIGAGTLDQVQRESEAYARRALELAPNLAHAHAALAFARSTVPYTEPELRAAVRLDPNDAEAWMWLGNCLDLQNRVKEALQAHGRAVEIEPLWPNSLFNKMDDFARLGDGQALSAVLRYAESRGDAYLTLRARQHVAALTGQIGLVARLEWEARRRFPDQVRPYDTGEILLQLGYIDEAAQSFGLPGEWVSIFKGKAPSSQQLRVLYRDPADLFRDDQATMQLARVLAKQPRLAEYIRFYKSAFKNADDYYAATGEDTYRFIRQAPNTAANLRTAGEVALAQQLLDKEEALIAPLMRNGPINQELAWDVAELRAAEGRDVEAMALIRRAITQGWLPDRMDYATDIADEPTFARLVSRPDFQTIRRFILARVNGEKRQITQQMLAEAGLAQAIHASS